VLYEHPLLAFTITSPLKVFTNEPLNRRKPGSLHHLAFRAASRQDVDRLHIALQGIGATIISAPREYPDYTPPNYYALFFKDPEGIKLRDRSCGIYRGANPVGNKWPLKHE